MLIKVAVVILGAVCFGGPVVQTFRFRRFGLGNPWRIPFTASSEGAGWMALAGAVLLLVLQGGLLFVGEAWYHRIPAAVAPDWARLAGLGIGVAGAAVSFGSQAAMGASWRVGTAPAAERQLVTAGIYNHVRNPIYLGFLLQILGAAVLLPTVVSLVAFAAAIAGLTLVVSAEERFLLGRFGEAYRRYMDRTGRFLPRMGPGA